MIFDADHTLFDFDRAEKNALTRILSDAGVDLSDSTLDKYHKINTSLWKRYELGTITQQKIKTERFKMFFETIGCEYDYIKAADDYLLFLSEGTDLLPGAYNLISDLKRLYKLGLLTNGISCVQHPRLENSELEGMFDTVVVSGDYGISKPDPKLFEILCKKSDFYMKNKMIIIGDSLTSDICGGINFGIDTCWFNPGKNKNQTKIKPKYEIAALDEIYNILKKGE